MNKFKIIQDASDCETYLFYVEGKRNGEPIEWFAFSLFMDFVDDDIKQTIENNDEAFAYLELWSK